MLRRCRAFISSHSKNAFGRGVDAAKWVWDVVCPAWSDPSKGAVVPRALEMSSGDLLSSIEGDELMDMLHGFREGHWVHQGAEGEMHVGTQQSAAQVQNIYEIAVKSRFGDARNIKPPLMVRKSISMKYNSVPKKEWRLRSHLGEVFSASETDRLLAASPVYRPSLPFGRACPWLKLYIKDNWEYYHRLTHVRIRNGIKEESNVVHCITGEECPLPADGFQDLDDLARGSALLQPEDQVDLTTIIPVKQTDAEDKLQAVFNKKVSIIRVEPHDMLGRPAQSEDKWSGGRTVTFHEPVLLDRGTVKHDDIEYCFEDMLRRQDPELDELLVMVGDNQTIANGCSVIAKVLHLAEGRREIARQKESDYITTKAEAVGTSGPDGDVQPPGAAELEAQAKAHKIWVSAEAQAKEAEERARQYKRIALLPGELHGHMHLVHAIISQNWKYIFEPICLLLGVTQIRTHKFLAKEHNEKQRLMFLVFTAGVKYLISLGYTDDELGSIPNLLREIKRNEPAHDFIHFLFYGGNHYVETVNATRTSDSQYSDFTWVYNLYIYANTRKMHYKLLCVLFTQVSLKLVQISLLVCSFGTTPTQASKGCSTVGGPSTRMTIIVVENAGTTA